MPGAFTATSAIETANRKGECSFKIGQLTPGNREAPARPVATGQGLDTDVMHSVGTAGAYQALTS